MGACVAERAIKRKVLLGERAKGRREEESLLRAYPFHVALSPLLTHLQATQLLQSEGDVIWYLALNPRIVRFPSALRKLVEALESTDPTLLADPFTPEGRALRGLLALSEELPKKTRRDLLALATVARIGLPRLDPKVAAPSP